MLLYIPSIISSEGHRGLRRELKFFPGLQIDTINNFCEFAMQDSSRNVPDDVKYAVLVAIAAAVIGTIQQLSESNLIGVVIAGACTVALYALGYSKLGTDVATARNAALVLAIVFGFFLVVSMQHAHGLYLLLNVVTVGCLGFTFLRLAVVK